MYEHVSRSSNIRISFAMSTLAPVVPNPAERNLHNAPWYLVFSVYPFICQVLEGRGRGGLSDNNMEVAMFRILVFEAWRTRKYGFLQIISECLNLLRNSTPKIWPNGLHVFLSQVRGCLDSGMMDHHFHNCLPFFSRVPSHSTSRPIKPHSWLHYRGSEVVYELPLTFRTVLVVKIKNFQHWKSGIQAL